MSDLSGKDKEFKASVLHICDKLGAGGSSIHGVSRLLSWWFPVLEEEGYKPGLCVLRPQDSAGDYFVERGIPVNYLGRSKFDIRTATDLIRILKKERPDIVHLHGYGSWTFGRLAARIAGVPVVLHEHMVGENVPLAQRISDFLLAGHDPVCVVSQAVYDFCVEKRYINIEDVVLVPNGIPLSEFCEPRSESVAALRKTLNVDENTLLIGSVGRLDIRKGYEYLIRAVPFLMKRIPDIRIIIAGDGDLEDELKCLATSLHVQDRVMFLGFWRDVRTLLALLDIVVVPSLSEGLPLSLLEAMAMRKPLVCTTAGGLGEVLEDNVTAMIVQERNPEDIADKIISLVADTAKLDKIAKNAQELAYKKYDIGNSARKMSAIYDEHTRKKSS